MNTEIPEVDPGMRQTAVSVYGDGIDDFPVLKAFQQYIDAEQARARKRLITFSIIFGVLMICVISVFVALLYSSNQRNQLLNDRLVEFAMRDRDRHSAVVVQPPVQQDNSAILALTAKMEELQQKLIQTQKQAEESEKARVEAAAKAAAEAAAEAAKPKEPSAEEIEIRRLRTLLAAEKERLEAERKKLAEERSRRREEELEAYRRKHYPELYEKPKAKPAAPTPKKTAKKTAPVVEELPEEMDVVDETDDEDEELDDSSAINYFKEESAPSGEKTYSIPVEVRGSKSKWRIPKD